MKLALGLVLAFVIGLGCGAVGIPSPAPPVIDGALLVLAMSLGYVLVERLVTCREAKSRPLCGGPSGQPSSSAPSRTSQTRTENHQP